MKDQSDTPDLPEDSSEEISKQEKSSLKNTTKLLKEAIAAGDINKMPKVSEEEIRYAEAATDIVDALSYVTGAVIEKVFGSEGAKLEPCLLISHLGAAMLQWLIRMENALDFPGGSMVESFSHGIRLSLAVLQAINESDPKKVERLRESVIKGQSNSDNVDVPDVDIDTPELDLNDPDSLKAALQVPDFGVEDSSKESEDK